MQEWQKSFVSRNFLRSQWALDYEAFKDSEEEKQLIARLRTWSERTDLGETSAVPAFLEEFFHKTWEYKQAGQQEGEAFTLFPEFSVQGAGAGGRTGRADAALGYFFDRNNQIPQVLCEFKGIKSYLDIPQKRKGQSFSPVKQGLNYLFMERRRFLGNEPILPTWAIISNMNEFRLYWADRGDRQFIRFIIQPQELFQGRGLLQNSENARFDRFLFYRLFHRDTLLVKTAGRSLLEQLIARQWIKERELEDTFYEEYKAVRDRLYQTLLEHNGEGTGRFPGTKGKLVRLTQKILDRFIFIFFCEDMGKALDYPPQLLRDFLLERSKSPYYDPEDFDIWQHILKLFNAMDGGETFGRFKLNRFNGGLFERDANIDKLKIPNKIFCMPGQGQNEASLHSYKTTLLYLSAAYNYAAGWDSGLLDAQSERSLSLFTLGRIFEQSITELEILEAEAEERVSVNKLGKRKLDGVYYTPEWVVDRIVAEALGRCLKELKEQAGWPDEQTGELPTAEAIEAYEKELRQLKILDPACGSGAFLITSLRHLLDEWHALQELRKQVTRSYTKHDDDSLIRNILANNIFGVDINPASVEISRLALWLHTVRGDKPLSDLDSNIRSGNSLIGPEFFESSKLAEYTEEEKGRINAFDWQKEFSDVFEKRGGFDIVVGNPPYVKLQNFRKAHPDMAEWLRDKTDYKSTKTGNFDLFLPFIERGINLLNEDGHLGYIAPSLWIMNDYGKGLRDFVRLGRHLWGWIDFGSYQVFREATTYTALQFYSRRPSEGIYICHAPDGVIPENPWQDDQAFLPWDNVEFGDRWLLLTGPERNLIDRLSKECRRLDHKAVTKQIFQGLITSKDDVYHLQKIGPGRYLCKPRGKDAPPPYEVEIEDDVMKPLVSGPQAKRYTLPDTNTYLLFPYRRVPGDGMELIPADIFERDYPKAWRYLKSWENDLREREGGKFDDSQWYRFGRHQNIDKQEIEKVVVAQTVPSMRAFNDANGNFYLNNVRVNGIIPAKRNGSWHITGIINSPVVDFIFRRIAKPKDGNWFEANKQFIAPLPIPKADKDDETTVSELAQKLQTLYTRRRDLLQQVGRRLEQLKYRKRPWEWLFHELPSKRDLREKAPGKLDAQQKKDWVNKHFEEALEARLSAVDSRVVPGVTMSSEFRDGELSFWIDGIRVVGPIFLDESEGLFIAAQWKLLASTFNVTASTTGRKLAEKLRSIGETPNGTLKKQIQELEEEISKIETKIANLEDKMNSLTFRLYNLTLEEQKLVMQDRP